MVSTYFVSFLQQVDLAKFKDNCKVDGLFAHSPWFLVEFNLLEDLWRETKHKQWIWTKLLEEQFLNCISEIWSFLVYKPI